jgi:hypothetical protein
MTGYIFILRQVKADLQFTVTAATRGEAVKLASEALQETGSLIFGAGLTEPDFHSAEWMIKLENKIDETMIAGETPLAADDLLEAHRVLEQMGYDYQGNNEMLGADDAPLFTKVLWTEDERGSDAFLRVRARLDSDSGVHNFHIEAVLYPTGRADLKRGEAFYAVDFRDKQYAITATDLPQAIEIYERKFTELIQILRRANS